MELIETGIKQIHNVKANKDGWKLNAIVTVEGGKISNIDGSAAYNEVAEGATPWNEMTRFNGRKEEDALRVSFDFRHQDADVCNILRAMVDAIIAKYDVAE